MSRCSLSLQGGGLASLGCVSASHKILVIGLPIQPLLPNIDLRCWHARRSSSFLRLFHEEALTILHWISGPLPALLSFPRRVAMGTFLESRDCVTCKGRCPHPNQIIVCKLSPQPALKTKPRRFHLCFQRLHCWLDVAIRLVISHWGFLSNARHPFWGLCCGILQCLHRVFSVTLVDELSHSSLLDEACKELHSILRQALGSSICWISTQALVSQLLPQTCRRSLNRFLVHPVHLGPGGSAAAPRQTEFSNSTKTAPLSSAHSTCFCLCCRHSPSTSPRVLRSRSLAVFLSWVLGSHSLAVLFSSSFNCSFVSVVANELSSAPPWTRAPWTRAPSCPFSLALSTGSTRVDLSFTSCLRLLKCLLHLFPVPPRTTALSCWSRSNADHALSLWTSSTLAAVGSAAQLLTVSRSSHEHRSLALLLRYRWE